MAYNGADQLPLPQDNVEVNGDQQNDPRYDAVRNALAALGIQIMAPPPRPQVFKYDSKTFAKLIVSTTDDELNAETFRTWEGSTKCIIAANGFQWPGVGHAILASLNQGEAGRISVLLQPMITNGQIQNLDQLMDALRSRIVGTSYQTKARARFNERVQQPKETIPAFHISLQDLWNRAFSPEERVHNEATLVTAFIAGLRNKDIQRYLSDNPPENYNDACQRALRKEGIEETLDHYQNRIKNNGRLNLPKKQYTAQGHLQGDNQVRPMEIGNVNRGRGYPVTPKGNKPKYVQKNGKKGQNSKAQNQRQNQPKNGKKASSSSIKCYGCGKKGHIKKNCRVRNVHALDTGNPEDEDGSENADDSSADEWGQQGNEAWNDDSWEISEN